MQLLTNAEKIRTVRDLSHNIKDTKINPIISDAQIEDLRPLLGDEFFYMIVTDPTSYSDLIGETKYFTKDGKESFSFGLERVVSEFAYARYKFDSTDISTPNGLVQKQNENAANTTRDRAKELYTAQSKIAVQYWLSVERYLINNRDLYPEFRNDRRKVNNVKTTYLRRNPWL